MLGIVRHDLKPGAGRLELLQGPWVQQRQALHPTSLNSDVYLCLPPTLYSSQEEDIAMPVYALLSTKRNSKKEKREGARERDLQKGLFRNRVCGSELRRWLPLQFPGFPFSFARCCVWF